MRTYNHIFFDLDHTLWDFDRNSSEMLSELYDEFKLSELTWKNKAFMIDAYQEINQKMWKKYNKGKITKEDLRVERFRTLFDKLGIPDYDMADRMDKEYINNCPNKPHLIEGALELLYYLSTKYIMHIITNGFEETSHKKVNGSGLSKYFDQIITSETVGRTKPDRTIFAKALHLSGAQTDESVMIGDNYATDILGAKKMNMDHIFFNHHNIEHEHKLQHEVNSLIEIKLIL